MKLNNGLNLYYWHYGHRETCISLENLTMLYSRPSKQLVFKFYKKHEIKLRSCLGNPLIIKIKVYEKKNII